MNVCELRTWAGGASDVPSMYFVYLMINMTLDSCNFLILFMQFSRERESVCEVRERDGKMQNAMNQAENRGGVYNVRMPLFKQFIK